MPEIIYSERFKKSVGKVEDPAVRDRIEKQIHKLMSDPEIGKPLRYELKNKRSLRIHPYRILYEYSAADDEIVLISFDHRKEVYK